MTDPTEEFVQQIAEHQNRMFGYIFSMVGDHTRASDVLQEANLVLWRKKDEFRTGSPFLPWAFAIARMQVLAHLRDRGRDRCLLDPELVELLSSETETQAEQIETVRGALQQCLTELTPQHRELIQQRYYRSLSIAELAQSLDRGVSAVKVTLMRVRRKLGECVQRRMVEA
ncbi:MAG: sigma-70 family RNA polymerase sigma factor [Pirellulaceae bacterium]|nr:sigma-70 family RNA polymerase sigma factor [Pirellulaceae bacterium]